MRYSLLTRVAGLASLTILAATLPTFAMMIAPAPLAERVATADVIVVGKITAIEEKTVNAKQFPEAKDKIQFGVAVIEVSDAITGAKAKSKVRLAFIPPPPPNPNPNGPVLLRKRRDYQPTVGDEACWLLTKHPDGDFYVPTYFGVIAKNSSGFEKDVALIKRSVKLLADPSAGLKSKEADDRLLTAGLLITRYRTAKPNAKTEPIDAEESKLILETLAAADWTKRDAPTQASALMYFNRLGLTEKDGWLPPKNGQDQAAAAQKWLKDNADKYRIQRLVVAMETK